MPEVNTLVQHIQVANIGNVWRIVLNLVDYFLVAFLIFISFANILRIQIDTYAIKKVIPSLVLGVIAANLSWFICLSLIDLASEVTLWEQTQLVDQVKSIDPNYLGEGLLGGIFYVLFQPLLEGGSGSSLTGISLLAIIGLGAGSPLATLGIAAALVGAIVVLLPIILFIIVYFLLLVRIAVVDILVIVSPLAFISLAFPMTQKLFQQWWGQFTRWVFMPVVAFFLWVMGVYIGAGIEKSAGTFTYAGLVKYVLIGACLYFSIKVPFMLGGGVMAAWGGLGKKMGMWGLRATDKKIGDFTSKVWGDDKRWSPYGMYAGWVKGAQRSWEGHVTSAAGGGEDIREGLTGIPSRAWGLATSKEKREALKSGDYSLWKTTGRGQAEATGHILNEAKEIALGSRTDNQLLNDLKMSVADKNWRQAQIHFAAATYRRLSVPDQVQEDFVRDKSRDGKPGKERPNHVGFLQAAERQSRINNVPGRLPFTAIYGLDEKGKVQLKLEQTVNDQANFLDSANAADLGASRTAAFSQLEKKKPKEPWSAADRSALQFLALQAERGNLGSDMMGRYQAIASQYKGTVLNQGMENAIHQELDSLDGKIDEEIQTVLSPKLDVLIKAEPGKITMDQQQDAHLFNYLRKNRPWILQKLGTKDQTRVNEALGKVPISPHFTITPQVDIKPDVQLSSLADTHQLVQGVDKKSREIFDHLQDPERLDLNKPVNIQMIEHFKNTGNVQKLEEDAKRLYTNMNSEIQNLLKEEGKTEINLDHAVGVNLREKIIEKGGISGLSDKEIEESINLHEKMKSVKQRMDGYQTRAKEMKQEEVLVNNLKTPGQGLFTRRTP